MLLAAVLGTALAGSSSVPVHQIEVRLDPPARSLVGTDRVTLGSAPARFELNRSLTVVQVEADGRDATERLRRLGSGSRRDLLAYAVDPAPGGSPPRVLVLRYGGTIEDPGAGATGGGGEEVLLLPRSGWYPRLGEGPSRFALVAELPPGWTAIAEADEVVRAGTRTSFAAEVPRAGLVLAAGRYLSKSLTQDALILTAYVREQNAPLQDVLLERARAAVERLAAISGPYPFRRLDLVESGLPATRSFSSLLLLGPDGSPADARDEGGEAREREIARIWWGGYVLAPDDEGSWSPGLATYLASHVSAEPTSTDAARRFRIGVSQRYSAVVTAGEDRPLRELHDGQDRLRSAADEAIAGKAAMMFHAIRRRLGDGPFLAALRLLLDRHGGEVARWDDLRKALEESARPPADLKVLFHQWLDWPGLPDIALARGASDSVLLVQPRERAYQLTVPLALERAGARDTIDVEVDSAEASVAPGSPPPDRVLLDPDFHVARRLSPADAPPCLDATLGASGVVAVYPASGPLSTGYRELAQRLAGRRGARVLSDAEASATDLEQPLLLLGSPVESSAARRALPAGRGLAFARDGVVVHGTLHRDPATVVLWSTRRPAGAPLTIVHALSAAALASASRLLPAHALETYVVLAAGRPTARGIEPREQAITLREAPPLSTTPAAMVPAVPTTPPTLAVSTAPGPAPPTPLPPVSPAPTAYPSAPAPGANPEPERPAEGDALRDAREVHLRSVRRLTSGGGVTGGAWSPDGSEVVFQARRPPLPCDQVFRLALATGTAVLVSTGRGRASGPSYLPSGLRVVFASTHLASGDCAGRPDAARGGVLPLPDQDVFTTRLDRSGLVQLTSAAGWDAEAAVSHDGSRIVFTSLREGDVELYSMASDGSDVRRLTSAVGYDGGAAFSPDDRKIAYRAERPPERKALARYTALLGANLLEPRTGTLMVAAADGSGARAVTSNAAPDQAPAWHPDATRLVFSSDAAGAAGGGGGTLADLDLHLVREDGTGLERITFHPGYDGSPAFSPDGTRMLWASSRGAASPGEIDLFVADWVP